MGNGKRFKLPTRTLRLVFDEDYGDADVVVKLDVPIGLFIEIQDMVEEGRQLDMFRAFGEKVLVSWNLDDEEGKPLPANAEGMHAITPQFGAMLIQQWAEVVANPPAPLAETSDNGSMSAEPTMEKVPG